MSHPTSVSLFDDDEVYNQPLSVVAALAHSKPVTKAQQNFRRLVAKIELKCEQLQQWQAYVPRYHQRLAGKYNQTLREQLADLESELDYFMYPFRCNTAQLGSALTPAFVDNCLNADIAGLKSSHRRLQHDLVALRDPKVLLDLLKYFELEQDDDVDNSDELIELMELMRSLQIMSGQRGKTPRRR